MLRKFITLISIGLIAGASAENSDKLDQIQKSLDKIVAKAGISIDGEVKSQYLSSQIGGEGANDTTNRSHESNEFSSVDFDIKARPNEMISGRVIFRMHQNWQNFFSDVANPIFTRWISIDGNVKDMVGFHVGDLREKYSPLTLYSPDIEILNEPYIFARQRQLAMEELFLGNNDRILQGINFKVDAEIVPLFNEFHFGLIGSRLRNIETSISNGSKVTQEIQTSNIAKYFIGANLDLTMLKGVNLGGTYLNIFDQKNSYRGRQIDADTIAQKTSVISVRPGVDIAKLIGSNSITLNLSTEFASSNDDSSRIVITGTDTSVVSSAIKGSAINIGAKVGISPSDKWGIKFNGSYIMNAKNYRNDLAQSPSFIGDRIMNVENNAANDNMYNTFDALDHYVFKFTPSSDGPNFRWAKSPFAKNSYRRSIYTQDEIAKMQAAGYFDPALQLVMPFGPATANRVGINADLTGNVLNNGLEVKVLFASLNEKDQVQVKADPTVPKKAFTQTGAGLKVDFSKFVPVFKYPLELSGSYIMSGMKRAADTAFAKYEVESAFLNMGLYYKFWKRTALLGGYQMIDNKMTGMENSKDSTVRNVKMGNWAAGLEWKVSDGADVVFTYGKVLLDIPEYTENTKLVKAIKIHQDVIDLSLCIRF